MLELKGLNGASIFIKEGSLEKIRPPYPFEDPAITVVEYGGGYLRTEESVAALLARLPNPPKMIKVTVPNGAERYINAGAITQLRTCAPENGTGSEMLVGSRYQHVRETVEKLVALIG